MIVRIASSFTFLLFLIIYIELALAFATTSTVISEAKDRCKGSCENDRVPYPFGIGPDCFLDSWFKLYWRYTLGTSNPNKTCNGSTCCETIIPSYLKTFNARCECKTSLGKKRCRLAFVVDEELLNFNITNPSGLLNMDNVPALIDWALPYGSTSIISSERVHSYGMYTSESSNISWRYFCGDGYWGNPYLPIGC
ncbi:wall-associated receptor kinase-like 22 [Gossypium australe]|uniref:Wall-associated receptor kinase-like 22 n=1 Tax=Gossypium australe TaxID=47621 RepID=A0A5B6VWZ5_9ROSI|nr:wall-associated receptor kinase-like 22 [Gossypium australe]